MRAAKFGVVAFGVVAVVAACSKSQSTSQGSKQPTASNTAKPAPSAQAPAIGGGPTDTAPHIPPSPRVAVVTLAEAECNHEKSCNNIGQGKKYKTVDECVSKVSKNDAKGVNAKSCPGGINEGNLNRCVAAMRDEACGSPIGALQRGEACKIDAYCMPMPKQQ
jgi:hypothetical protein